MQPETLNDRGQLLFKLEKGDFSGPDALQYRAALVLATLEQSNNICRADFDGDGTIDTDDILSFITDWTSHRASADLNHDGMISVQDLFDFINVWIIQQC